jgi:hypothetical protein
MRQVILKEVVDVIPEAKFEPSVIEFGMNDQESIMEQEKQNLLS